jgi:hypothetical protein
VVVEVYVCEEWERRVVSCYRICQRESAFFERLDNNKMHIEFGSDRCSVKGTISFRNCCYRKARNSGVSRSWNNAKAKVWDLGTCAGMVGRSRRAPLSNQISGSRQHRGTVPRHFTIRHLTSPSAIKKQIIAICDLRYDWARIRIASCDNPSLFLTG